MWVVLWFWGTCDDNYTQGGTVAPAALTPERLTDQFRNASDIFQS
jgi:hypothetical protein